MICAACCEPTSASPCDRCGADPLLSDRYRLDALVAEGHAGVTWRGTRLSDEARVAVKELPVRRARTPKDRELIEREAAVLRQLEDPGIPRFHETFTTGSGRARSVWIVEEFVEGTTLLEHANLHRYSEEEVLCVLDDVLGILMYLHGLSPPVIHRDIKPANVMRTPDGRHVLVDFGAVRDVIRDPALGGSTVAGTFGYMAPEQFRGDAAPSTDLYGLGALAVFLLTRVEPHSLQDYHQNTVWEQQASVSHELASLVSAMVAPDPAQRPQSARRARKAVHNVRFPALRRYRPDAWGDDRFRTPFTGRPLSPNPYPAPVPQVRAPAVLSPPRPRDTLRELLENVNDLRETRLQRATREHPMRLRQRDFQRGMQVMLGVSAVLSFAAVALVVVVPASVELVQNWKDDAIWPNNPYAAALPPPPVVWMPPAVPDPTPLAFTEPPPELPNYRTAYRGVPAVTDCFEIHAPEGATVELVHVLYPDGSVSREVGSPVTLLDMCVLDAARGIALPGHEVIETTSTTVFIVGP